MQGLVTPSLVSLHFFVQAKKTKKSKKKAADESDDEEEEAAARNYEDAYLNELEQETMVFTWILKKN